MFNIFNKTRRQLHRTVFEVAKQAKRNGEKLGWVITVGIIFIAFSILHNLYIMFLIEVSNGQGCSNLEWKYEVLEEYHKDLTTMEGREASSVIGRYREIQIFFEILSSRTNHVLIGGVVINNDNYSAELNYTRIKPTSYCYLHYAGLGLQRAIYGETVSMVQLLQDKVQPQK
ncbi:hypothetical protein L6452_36091 [Arctium lappa]|uniref:Uncharacterized protein n=1 Tax=Arctium lappa TaxID=4217 RepID=A0ACB8Y942_ARCLA|nr:hypothetical protein L6452_36091 [Arctium lappa]